MIDLGTKCYYVYALVDPRNNRIFYVGKGLGDRVAIHEREAQKGHKSAKCETIREIWAVGLEIERRMLATNLSEQAAYDLEASTIDRIGLRKLTNRNPGGAYGRPINIDPEMPLADIPLDQMIEYLRTVRGTEKQKQDLKAHWIKMRTWALREDWRKLRRQQEFEEADRLWKELEDIRFMTGQAAQHNLPL